MRKKIFFITGILSLVFSLVLMLFNMTNSKAYADDILPCDNLVYLKIDGMIHKHPGQTSLSGKGWTYDASDGYVTLRLTNYNGGSIYFGINESSVVIEVYGSCYINAEDDVSYGIGSDDYLDIKMRGNLTINSTATCIFSKTDKVCIESNTGYTNYIKLNSESHCIYSKSSTYVMGSISLYGKSKEECYCAYKMVYNNYYPEDLSTWQYGYDAACPIIYFYVEHGAAVYGISEEKEVFDGFEYEVWRQKVIDHSTEIVDCQNGFYQIGDYVDYECQDKIYTSRDCKVMSVVSNPEELFSGFIQVIDQQYKSFSGDKTTYKQGFQVGKSEHFQYNTEALPQQLIDAGFVMERYFTLQKNGSETYIASVLNDTTNNLLEFDYTFEDLDLYVVTRTVKLFKNASDSNPVSTLVERCYIYPYTYHTIFENDDSFELVDLVNKKDNIRTGDKYSFSITLNDYYIENPDMIVYANGQQIEKNDSGYYTIENVREDIEISVYNGPKYYANYETFVGDAVVDSGKLVKSETMNLPSLDSIDIPEGMVFDYWKVGNRKNHYQPGQAISLKEEERGYIRIEAHFQGVYNLTGIDGHFYSDIECTQEITQAASVAIGSAKYTYFKFNDDFDEVIDGKMLYSYNSSCDVNVDIWDNNGILFFEMPAGDVSISPVYKYVIDEITVEGVQLPISGNELIENQEHAPDNVNYKVAANSSWYEIVDEENRKYLNTFGYGDPYVFKNDTRYELEIMFTVAEYGDYLFDPNGYARDGEFQFNIDGLEDSQYEVVVHKFANSYKRQYIVTLRFNVINTYNVSVENGFAIIGEDEVTLVQVGQEVLLSASKAPTGKVFDHWTITGIEVTEEDALNSKLVFEMPTNEVTAVATYKDAEYFEITFDPNGGSSVMADDTTYGEYELPECIFIAPEHKHFKCWQIDDIEYDELTPIAITENTVVKAIWEYDSFEITFDANGGEGTKDSETKEYNSSYELPEANTFVAPEHKHFKCWLIGDVEYDELESIIILDDIEIKAIWEIDTFEITFDANGGTGSKDSLSVEYNGEYKLPKANLFEAPANKEFKCYLVNGVEKNAEETIIITEDTLIKASWKDKESVAPITDDTETTTTETNDSIDPESNTNSNSQSDTKNNNNKKANNAGATVGIIIGVVAGIAVIGAIVFIVIKKRK